LVLAWSPVAHVDIDDVVRVELRDGTTHVHRRTAHGWSIQLAGATEGTVDLDGRVASVYAPSNGQLHRSARLALRYDKPHTIQLGEPNYRRSEASWREAGSPSATVILTASDASFGITVVVPRSDRTFVPRGATNRYDNEPADINGDGVQLHIRTATGPSAWLLVPEADSDRVRVRPIGSPGATAPRASWRPAARGYEMVIELPAIPRALDVIVNEMPAGRERRRGQLVMSGADGEFVYLRGDRHDAERLVNLQIDE
jgi:hypothetical protein